MAYTPGNFDRNHLQLTWGGKLPGGEDWSCSLKLADGRTGSLAAANDAFLATVNVADAVNGYIKDAILAFHTRVATNISAAAKLNYAKLALIGREGRYPDGEDSQEYVFANVGGGGPGGTTPPNQVALVVSLLTPYTRGPAHRGRFYLPLPIIPVSTTDGLISAADANAVAGSAKTFLEDLSDVPGLDLPSSPGVVVMSRKSGAATTRIVTGVEVGRVLDTQRRRRRSLPESYSHVVVDQGLA
jgi:hypothetical protein